MKKILVIGSTGKVGKWLTSELIEAGETVRAATRNPKPRAGRLEDVRFTFEDPATYASALEGVDRVFLVEPQVPRETTSPAFMIPFLKVATDAGRKVVLQSTLTAEFYPDEPLLELEGALKNTGSPFVILRPNWFMDNFHTLWLEPIRGAGVIPVPAGDSRTSFIDCRDIAAAAVAALRTTSFDGRAIALTGPQSLSYDEAAATLTRASGREIHYVPVEAPAFLQSLLGAGLPEAYAKYIGLLFEVTRAGKAAAVSPEFEELTQRKPRTFAEYAQHYADAWR